MGNIIVGTGIKKGFPVGDSQTFWALKGLDLEIPEGKLTILKGKSGSGKTTLMNILSTLDQPTQGRSFWVVSRSIGWESGSGRRSDAVSSVSSSSLWP